MSSINFAAAELASALARGVRQCVVIGSFGGALKSSPGPCLRVFAVGEEQPSDLEATFVPTQFASEALASALEKSEFDKKKAALFIWLGCSGYRTLDTAVASLAFIASLPRGSGVVFDYLAEHTSLGSLAHSALDALASRICLAGDGITHFIQPQALTAMLRSLGFQQIVDLTQQEQPLTGTHLVSAMV